MDPDIKHAIEIVGAAVSGFGGAWAREKYRRPKAGVEPIPSRREMEQLATRVATVERRADTFEWDIRQIKTEKTELATKLDTLVTGMQAVQVTLARLGERLGLVSE